jgi:hypothetical protein
LPFCLDEPIYLFYLSAAAAGDALHQRLSTGPGLSVRTTVASASNVAMLKMMMLRRLRRSMSVVAATWPPNVAASPTTNAAVP